MRTPPPSSIGLLCVAAVGAAALLLGTGGSGSGAPSVAVDGSWRGLVGADQPSVTIGQRVIVVLRAPSLAQRVAQAGGIASTADERRWTAAAYASQQDLITRLAVQGIGVKPEFSFARVLNGFSAALGPGAIAVLERSSLVRGVYPVRAAFPATLPASALRGAVFGAGSGRRPDVQLPQFDGRGVTVALLDTGVDGAQPYLHGRVLPGIDVVGGDSGTMAQADPLDATSVETHGTELAGLLVGAGGPFGLAGVAQGASLLPIRVAGWQPDARGAYAVYARSDQLIAGLERAVDPSGDGDAHDGARVALIGLAERYAGFADSPEARAVEGAFALDTLVVAAAGNDGAAGPGFGSVAGPGGAPAALTVGADDARGDLPQARVVLRRGLDVLYDRTVPLLGAVAPASSLDLEPAQPRVTPARSLTDFFTPTGFSLVAGRAAVVAVGDDPAATARRAAEAGAAAVVLYGDPLPAGSLGLDADLDVPVVAVPAGAAVATLGAAGAGADVAVSIGPAPSRANPGQGRAASFSSRGLAFDGRVKPELLASGVGLVTSDPGTDFVTVNGTSAAAAVVAGAAALLAQARPGLDAPALKSLLVGSARPTADTIATSGAGRLDVGAAAAAEVAAEPASLAFGAWTGKSWKATQTIVVRNVSTRRLRVSAVVQPAGGESEVLAIRVEPAAVVLRPGASRTVIVTATLAAPPSGDLASGTVELRYGGARPLRIPWAIDYRPYRGPLLASASLASRRFAPSDTVPVRLEVQAGAVVHRRGTAELQPVGRLDVQLYRSDGTGLGLLARVRDLLPGRYTFGLTGRDARGRVLPAGRYRLRLVAWPTLPGKPTVATLPFELR